MRIDAGWAPRTRTALLAILSGLLFIVPAGAQTSTGNIRGYVRDPSGQPVVGATVTAQDPQTNAQRAALTTSQGFYYLGGLRPGTYQLSVQMLGFAEQNRPVRLLIGQTLDVDFALSEQAVALEGIEVTAERTHETRTSEVASNVTREQIENLPLQDRNFLSLAQLAPGVRATQTGSGERKTFASGAQPAEAVNVFIDGASYKNDVLQGGVAGQDASAGNPFPQNAVQEFRIVTQNYKAEYQKAGSAIITATTRSGTNQWEASAFGFNICSDCISKDAIARRDDLPAPDYKRWQFGASLGGPIQRDKLFFFGTYEGNFRDEPQNVVPGDLSVPVPGLDPSDYAGTFNSEFREHLFFGKLTYTPTPTNTIDVSANIRTEHTLSGFGGQTSRQSAENKQNDVYTGVANWKHVAGQWLNEAQVSVQRYSWNPVPLNAGEIGKNYFGVIRIGGRDTRQDFTQDRFSLRNDLSYSGFQLGGQHVLKGGFSLDFLKYSAEKFFVANPVFNFRSDENFAFPFEALIGFGDPSIDANNTQFGVYVQDDWSVTPKLVLNLGVRWDIETNMINNDFTTPQQIRDSLSGPLNDLLLPVVDRLGGLDEYFTDGSDRPMYLGAIQPRLGFSYDLFGDQRTVVFGGFGVYYDRDYWNTMLDEQFRRQFAVVRVCFGPVPRGDCPTPTPWDERYFDPDQLRVLAESGTSGAPEVFLIRNDTKPPKVNQFSAGVRQQVGPALVTATYTGSRGYNGYAYIRGTPCCNALLPTYSNLIIADPRVKSRYNALLLKVEKPIGASRWGGAIAYTLGKAEQKGDYFFALDARFPTVADYPWRPARDASGVGDQRHTLVINGIVRLPYEIMFSTLANFGSGFPQYATDCSANGCGPDVEREYFFFPPKESFFGLGHVFANRNVDFRAEKAFVLPNGNQVGLTIDLFNAFNYDNFFNYDAFIPPPGQTNDNFLVPRAAMPGRRIQIGLKYGFQQGIE